MTKPSYQDAMVLLQLARWQTTHEMLIALGWLRSDQFYPDYATFAQAYPPGSNGDCTVALICMYFETVGTLYKHGIVDENLLFDWLAVGPMWDALKGYVHGQRQASGNLALWTNFEALSVAYKRSTREYST